ncbi:hypothetical protein [Microvirga massiliensis]|uniref:hypothetical protein n=1 Tax=Microvirga massiliensis TaxID=1033741 RepID=UPI00062B62E6|nr:hypothetical protein [Microvirga massiliensis]
MTRQTVEVDPIRLQAGIEALARAGQAFRLSRFERVSYRALMVSVDVAIVSFLAMIVLFGITAVATDDDPGFILIAVMAFVFSLAVAVGIIALVLNIPLFLRASGERGRLKQLGLDALSKSLWKESRRSRWISRIRSGLIIAIGALSALVAVTGAIIRKSEIDPVIVLFCGMLAMVLFAARYLRNQRERIELAASADKLRTALLRVQERAGEGRPVAVPSDLLAQAARIETAQIAQERKDAVLQSVASRPTGYAVAFDQNAAEQRAKLDLADRIDLEDLVAQISTAGATSEPQAGTVFRRDGAMFRARTSSGHIEIECVLDEASRSIRVAAVTRAGAGAQQGGQTDTGHG